MPKNITRKALKPMKICFKKDPFKLQVSTNSWHQVVGYQNSAICHLIIAEKVLKFTSKIINRYCKYVMHHDF